MSVQSFAEASDRSLHPTDAKSDKNYFASSAQATSPELEVQAKKDASEEGESAFREESPSSSEDTHSPTPNGKSRVRAGGSSRSKASKMKAHDADAQKDGEETIDQDSNPKAKPTIELGSLKQKAMDLVHKSSEELAHRYSHAYDDMKDVSKKVSERMKGKPYQIAMGAASVVGLGMVLAKKYTQNRSMKSPGTASTSGSADTLHS